MDLERIKRSLKYEKQVLEYLKSLEANKKYDIESAKEYSKDCIEEYQKVIDKTTDEHKQLCESLQKEFPGDIVKDCDLKTLRELNRIMNDDSLTEIQKSTWYMLIVNYQK